MSKWRQRTAAAAVGIAVGLGPTSGRAQEIDILMALPAATLTFSAAFLAEDAGFYKREGLKVSYRTIVGVGSVNAVIAGSADFTMGTGPVFLRAAAQGQRLLALANLIDKPLVELVLRKDVAAAAGVNDAMPLAERAKALKALETKQIDGYATSLPFTTQAVLNGSAVMLASAVRDAPDLLPFAYGLVYTRPDMCGKAREKCVRMVRALAGANRFIHEKPAEALELLKKRFDKMDAAVLAAAWEIVAQAHAKDIRVTVPGLDHSQKVSLEAKLLEPKDALANFDGLYTDEFVR
jgi:NitT/TauT family transport system substrate-binding protein